MRVFSRTPAPMLRYGRRMRPGGRQSLRWAPVMLAAMAIGYGWPAAADAPAEIGRSILVVSDVEGRLGEAPPRRIVVNDDVVYQEDIVTGEEAKTVIEFRDGSTFEVGPQSAVRIDSFVFNPEEGINRKVVEVGRGVFRYVSGFAAPAQNTSIATATGTLAIRGSVVAGFVEPDTPTFFYVGEGNAVFTNDAGSAQMPAGSAIAVPTRATAVMSPAAMPPAIVAQALQAINRRLPPDEMLRRRPPASEAWLRRSGAANLLPAAEQDRQAAAAARGRPLPAPSGPSRIGREVNLLVEGNRRNLFDGAHAARTPEQQAFLSETSRAMPQARMMIARSTAQATALHRSANRVGAAFVMRGVAVAAPTPEVRARVAVAAARSNPAAASLIRQSATLARREPERAQAAPQFGSTAREAAKPQPRAAGMQRLPARQARSTSPAMGRPGVRSMQSPPLPRFAASQTYQARPARPPGMSGPPRRAGPSPRGAPPRERAARGPRPGAPS